MPCGGKNPVSYTHLQPFGLAQRRLFHIVPDIYIRNAQFAELARDDGVFARHAVEQDLQCPIFDRSVTPLALTEPGEYYIHCIEKILEIEKDMQKYFARYARADSVNIGCGSYCYTYVLPEIIKQFNELHRDVKVNITEANYPDEVRQVKDGDFDIMLAAGSSNDDSLTELPYMEEHIVLAVPASMPINARYSYMALPWDAVRDGSFLSDKYPALSLKGFSKETFIFLKKGNDMYSRGMQMCRNAGFEPHVAMYVDQVMTSYYLACEGRGIAFMRTPYFQYAEGSGRVKLYKIDDPLTNRFITFTYNEQRNFTRGAALFIEFIKQHVEQNK